MLFIITKEEIISRIKLEMTNHWFISFVAKNNNSISVFRIAFENKYKNKFTCDYNYFPLMTWEMDWSKY